MRLQWRIADRWSRTAAAILSLHNDKEDALATLARHDSGLNAVFQGARLLVEFALCECPLNGGRGPGSLDMSRLMTRSRLIFDYGGWSDAIRWDLMPAKLRVTPLGDIHADLDFMDEVIEPFGRTGSDARVNDAIENYASNVSEPTLRRSVESAFDATFIRAWKEEFGTSLDEMRTFVDFVEDMGIRAKAAVLKVRRSQLLTVAVGDQSIAEDTARVIVESLSFRTRATWREVPQGYDESDRQPWRFRRRLSVLRKPLLQLDEHDDPMVIVAPGILRDSLVYMLGNHHRGDVPPRQLKPAMRSWAGNSRDKQGNEFSRLVAQRLRDLGWCAESEIKVTHLLKRGFDEDYGDVDVLAWNPDVHRVLVIECKDVQYRKTYGEIAEQLADFRGELRSDGKPDHLLRHLRRVDVISRHLPAIAQYIGAVTVSQVESHLVFRNPVPMQFSLTRLSGRVAVHIYDGLSDL